MFLSKLFAHYCPWNWFLIPQLSITKLISDNKQQTKTISQKQCFLIISIKSKNICVLNIIFEWINRIHSLTDIVCFSKLVTASIMLLFVLLKKTNLNRDYVYCFGIHFKLVVLFSEIQKINEICFFIRRMQPRQKHSVFFFLVIVRQKTNFLVSFVDEIEFWFHKIQ